jgi:hypothetical protein
LKEAWRPGQRVTLIGHSTGAIYIGEFLKHADGILPPTAKFDVVFLAPACTFGFADGRLDVFKRRVANIRSFGLRDAIERGYWEVPVLYRGSLLYLVSGLFEDAVDEPVVGMQRYFDPDGPYDAAAVRRVREYLAGKTVWSEDVAQVGRKSTAREHGGFDEDAATLESIGHILEHGF